MAGEFSSIGLAMAGATSVSNVLKDVASKKALDTHEITATTFWFRLIVAVLVSIFYAFFFWNGYIEPLKDGGALFGIAAWHLAPLPTFLIYVAIDGIGIGLAALLFYRALQVSSLSVCTPFLAFTPIFLIPTGYILLGELPPPIKLLGVILVVVGSLVMHRQLFKVGIFAPVIAVWREKGSRYVLIVAFIFSLTNPLDKILVNMGGSFTQAFAYSIAIFIFFAILAFSQKADLKTPLRAVPHWLLLSGLLDATALIFQLTSHKYIDVVITISVKRAGILLAVFLGWLIFRERNITDKVIASCVMLCGVLIIYLPLNAIQAIAFMAFALIGMAFALYFTRRQITEPDSLKELTARIEGEQLPPAETAKAAKAAVHID